MVRSHPVLTMLSAVALAAVCAASTVADRQVVFNTSPSIAPGIYVRASSPPALDTLVEFRMPPDARPYIRSRVAVGSPIADWYLLKPVVAGPGDCVDTTGAWLTVNGRQLGPMPPERDAAGRPLPHWRAERRLGPDEFFTFSARVPNSFDSRCFGPVRRGQITTVRRLLWAW